MPDSAVWNRDNLSDPHGQVDKPDRVRAMFASIARRYDFNNRLHSFGIDQLWRKATVSWAELKPQDAVVDVACGTGDLTLAFERGLVSAGATMDTPRVIGVDFTFEMLPLAEQKWRSRSPSNAVQFLAGDALALPLPDASADVVSIAFGIRNVADIDRAMAEFHRVLRPGGRLLILEFSEPPNRMIRMLNNLYTQRLMPITATLLSGDKTGAYVYLPRSVDTFIGRGEMVRRMEFAGLRDVVRRSMTCGVVTLYRGVKPVRAGDEN